MKKILKVLGIILLIILTAVILFFIYLMVTEYKPEDVEEVNIQGQSNQKVQVDTEYTAFNWNIGYSGLDKYTDFFMDGGQMVHPISRENVENALDGIVEELSRQDADIYFLQEVDEDSTRSFHINQVDMINNALGGNSTFAYNYKVEYVPFPLPPLGQMASGIYTNTDFTISSSYRYQQPIPFKWPVRLANLKRAFNASYMEIEGSDKSLVTVNVHLDAYDSDNDGKVAQTMQLMDFIQSEYDKGNYVILAGDLNQDLRDGEYQVSPEGVWEAQPFAKELIPENFQLAYDDSVFTTRVNDKPYDPETAYQYVIDGYIVSDNIEVIGVETLDLQYEDTDHNPVKLVFKLK